VGGDSATWARSLVGQVLCGRYRVEGLVGVGGMGAVLAAIHTGTGRTVAVKVMLPELLEQGDLVRRFHREARTAASVGGRGVAEVLDLDSDPAVGPILVLEMLTGENLLARVIREGALPIEEAVRIGLAALATLRTVHDKGIVHRDLKPANVFLTRDDEGERVKLLDFGIARVETAMRTTMLTLPGTAIGTPRYMPPEQAAGMPDVDARADLYAVGAILYFMLAGEPPYADVDAEALRGAVLAAPPTPITELQPSLPTGLTDVVARAMARDPAARFENATAMRDALAAWAAPGASPAGVGAPSHWPVPATAVALPVMAAAPETRRDLPVPPTAGGAAGRAAGPAPRASPPAQPRTVVAPQARKTSLWLVAVGVLGLAGALGAAGMGIALVHGREPAPAPPPTSVPAPPVQIASQLAAALEAAKKSIANGDRMRGAEELRRAVEMARHAGVAPGEPAALPAAQSLLALATSEVTLAPTSGGSCLDAARELDGATNRARAHVAEARRLDPATDITCPLGDLVRAEVTAAVALEMRATGDDAATCSTAAGALRIEAANVAVSTLTGGNPDCAPAIATALARPSGLPSSAEMPRPGGGHRPPRDVVDPWGTQHAPAAQSTRSEPEQTGDVQPAPPPVNTHRRAPSDRDLTDPWN